MNWRTVTIHEDRIVEGTELFNVDISQIKFTPYSTSSYNPPATDFNQAGGKVQIDDNDNAVIKVTPASQDVAETAGSVSFTAELLAGSSTAPASTIAVQDAFTFDALTIQGLPLNFPGVACGDDVHVAAVHLHVRVVTSTSCRWLLMS